MDEQMDDKPRRRQEDVGLPPWAKLALATIGGTILVIGWVEVRFVPRIEYENHVKQQILDAAELKEQQRSYALAERGTSTNLGLFDARLTRIETKIDLLLEPPQRRK